MINGDGSANQSTAHGTGINEIMRSRWDVVIVGGGNAAMVAAISARHLVDKVLVLERAPRESRGGNTRHTRNIRCVHNAADAYNTGSYLYEELWSDLCNVGEGPSNEKLASITVAESEKVPAWMSEHGIRWQPPLKGTLHLGRTNRFFLGGGKALVNSYQATLAKMGITVIYEALVEDLLIEGDNCTGVIVNLQGGQHKISSDTVVCASGGFEANLDWLSQYWGDAVANYSIRGAEYNDGIVLKALYSHGANSAGQEKGFHAVAVDARSPKFDGGIATRLDTIPFSIVVNKFAKRFYDEGEDIWPKRYAIWGRNIAEQPGQSAFSIWDSKVNHLFIPPMYGPVKADTIEELARFLNLDVPGLIATVDEYNRSVSTNESAFDPSRLDACGTSHLAIPKSNWAQRIDAPPFFGIAMRPGITFTYMGVEVNERAQVMRSDGSTFNNLFAAGEIMSGNILSTGYLAGFGLTIGSVWGLIAGKEAASVNR